MWKHLHFRPTAVGAVLSGLIVLFGGLYALKTYREHAAGSPAGVTPTIPVAVEPARTGPLPDYLEGVGSLKAVRQVVIAPEVGGTVMAIQFESGAVVAAGAPILQINDAPDRGDLERFRGVLWYAERENTRHRRLAPVGAVSKSDAENTESKLTEARGQVARTEAVIAQKRLCAPFAGVLGVRLVDQGQYLQPGQPVVSLTDLDQLYVNFSLPEQSLPLLSVGLKTDVLVDAYPGHAFPAVITTVEPQVSPESRTVQVQGTLDNTRRVLRPGMFAAVRVVLPPGPAVVTVPETALDRTVAGDSAFVLRSTDKGQVVDRVAVKAGRRSGDRVIITEGIKAGDLVVTAGQLKLSPGTPVSVADAGPHDPRVESRP